MRINRKFGRLLTGLIVAFGMSLAMSFVMVAINVGFTKFFVFAWLRAWFVGFLIAIPAAALIIPIAQKIVSYLTTEELE